MISSYSSLSEHLKPLHKYRAILIIKKNNLELFNQIFSNQEIEIPNLKISAKKPQSTSKEYILNGIFGNGGTKLAVKMSNGKALIVPNGNETQILENWDRIVDEEVKMGKLLEQIGLLCPKYQRIQIESPTNIPAYISKSFDLIAQQENIYVIDMKNPETSTWDAKTHSLFKNEKNKLDLHHWQTALTPLIEDIGNIFLYQIPTNYDSFNLAIVQNNEGCIVRYFGFDFSDKWTPLTIPSGEKTEILEVNEKQLTRLIDNSFDIIFDLEFKSQSVNMKELSSSLKEWAVKTVLIKLKK